MYGTPVKLSSLKLKAKSLLIFFNHVSLQKVFIISSSPPAGQGLNGVKGETMTSFERRQCHGKRRYYTQKTAEHVAAKMTKKYHVEYNVYICEVFGSRHVGHKKTSFHLFPSFYAWTVSKRYGE